MTRNATDEVFAELLDLEGLDYFYDGDSGRGLPSGLETISNNDLETTMAKAELIRVPRSEWRETNFKTGGYLVENWPEGKRRRIIDTDDDGTSRTILLIVSLD